MLEQKITDGAVETINSTRRLAYDGVQYTRLNYKADTAVPLYTTPYEQMELADVANNIFADGDDDDIYRHLDGFSTCIFRYRTCVSICFTWDRGTYEGKQSPKHYEFAT